MILSHTTASYLILAKVLKLNKQPNNLLWNGKMTGEETKGEKERNRQKESGGEGVEDKIT